jgi:hypothetical protein
MLTLLDGTLNHRQPVHCGSVGRFFVRTLSGGNKDKLFSLQHLQSMVSHAEMTVVNRIKRSSEQDDSFLVFHFLSQPLVKNLAARSITLIRDGSIFLKNFKKIFMRISLPQIM